MIIEYESDKTSAKVHFNDDGDIECAILEYIDDDGEDRAIRFTKDQAEVLATALSQAQLHTMLVKLYMQT